MFFLCSAVLINSWFLLFLCLGLGFLLVASESYFESLKFLASCFCVAIKLDLFSTKFWFCFVCVMHMIWLTASVGLFCFVYVVTS